MVFLHTPHLMLGFWLPRAGLLGFADGVLFEGGGVGSGERIVGAGSICTGGERVAVPTLLGRARLPAQTGHRQEAPG